MKSASNDLQKVFNGFYVYFFIYQEGFESVRIILEFSRSVTRVGDGSKNRRRGPTLDSAISATRALTEL